MIQPSAAAGRRGHDPGHSSDNSRTACHDQTHLVTTDACYVGQQTHTQRTRQRQVHPKGNGQPGATRTPARPIPHVPPQAQIKKIERYQRTDQQYQHHGISLRRHSWVKHGQQQQRCKHRARQLIDHCTQLCPPKEGLLLSRFSRQNR